MFEGTGRPAAAAAPKRWERAELARLPPTPRLTSDAGRSAGLRLTRGPEAPDPVPNSDHLSAAVLCLEHKQTDLVWPADAMPPASVALRVAESIFWAPRRVAVTQPTLWLERAPPTLRAANRASSQ